CPLAAGFPTLHSRDATLSTPAHRYPNSQALVESSSAIEWVPALYMRYARRQHTDRYSGSDPIHSESTRDSISPRWRKTRRTKDYPRFPLHNINQLPLYESK